MHSFLESVDWGLVAMAAGLGAIAVVTVETVRSLRWRELPSLRRLVPRTLFVVALIGSLQFMIEFFGFSTDFLAAGIFGFITGAVGGANRLFDRREHMRLVRDAGLPMPLVPANDYVLRTEEPVDNKQRAANRTELDALVKDGRVIGYREEFWRPLSVGFVKALNRSRLPREHWITIEVTRYRGDGNAREAAERGESHALRERTKRSELGRNRRRREAMHRWSTLNGVRWHWSGRALRNLAGDASEREDDTVIYEARFAVRSVLVEVTGDGEVDVHATAVKLRRELELLSRDSAEWAPARLR